MTPEIKSPLRTYVRCMPERGVLTGVQGARCTHMAARPIHDLHVYDEVRTS